MARRYCNPYETTVGEKIAGALAVSLIVLVLSAIAFALGTMAPM
ncbi:MAG TPA: hypothetical protein VFA57_20085 [Pseudolabrys sp.]|nr:hypothetical protein [Pseudolabrys sp.]